MDWIIAILGTGALSSYLTYILRSKKEKRASYEQFTNDMYKQIGRLEEKIAKLEIEKKTTDEENLALKKKNYRMEIEFEDLKRDYEELRKSYAELKKDYEEIKILLIKRVGDVQ